MADDVFEEDFLQRVVNVQWGGVWLEVSISDFAPLNTFKNCSVDFVNQAGGTPGYQMFGPGSFIQPRFRPLPLKMTAAMLAGKFPPDAGAAFVGFGVRNVSPADAIGNVTILASLWLKCATNKLLDKDIALRLNFPVSGFGTNCGVIVALHSKAPKADQLFQIGNYPPPDNNPNRGVKITPAPPGDVVALDTQNPSGLTASYNWTINVPRKTIQFTG